MTVLAIDPGDQESAYCFVDSDTLEPGFFGKVPNEQLLGYIHAFTYDRIVIERIASYGMAVGRNVFETCEWVGRFTQAALPAQAEYIYRKEEKLHVCGDSKAKDANIRRALIDRFARHDLQNGKGTKKDPDFFYGFRADVWAAYAVALTYIETKTDIKPSEVITFQRGKEIPLQIDDTDPLQLTDLDKKIAAFVKGPRIIPQTKKDHPD